MIDCVGSYSTDPVSHARYAQFCHNLFKEFIVGIAR